MRAQGSASYARTRRWHAHIASQDPLPARIYNKVLYDIESQAASFSPVLEPAIWLELSQSCVRNGTFARITNMRASFADSKPARLQPEGVNIFPPEGINMRSHKLACLGTNTAGPAGTQEHELHFDQT